MHAILFVDFLFYMPQDRDSSSYYDSDDSDALIRHQIELNHLIQRARQQDEAARQRRAVVAAIYPQAYPGYVT